MTFSFESLLTAVKQNLSVIGKRMYTKDGKNLFSDITTSTAEDPIFNQYFFTASQNIEAMLSEFIDSYSFGSESLTITFKNRRGIPDFDARCGDMIGSYISLYATGEYLAMTHPDLAKKYQDDSVSTFQSLTVYAFTKKEPTTATTGYSDITGTVS